MRNNCDCQKQDCTCNSSSSGFIFGLILGAIIGAVIAVLIYKNDKGEVFEKLEQKIKKFFNDLIPADKIISAKSPKKIVAKKEIKPVFVKTKKPIPKTFLKPKK
jgi:gas vesicle protein